MLKKATQLISNFTQCLNPFRTRYPVVDGWKKSYLFNPHPKFSESHWYNKNRHPWSDDEIEDLMKEYFEFTEIQPVKTRILAVMYEPQEDTKMVYPTITTSHYWKMARLLRMGTDAFDSKIFPNGAPATYGDYFIFNSSGVQPIKLRNGKQLLIMHDSNIIVSVPHPQHIIRAPK